LIRTSENNRDNENKDEIIIIMIIIITVKGRLSVTFSDGLLSLLY